MGHRQDVLHRNEFSETCNESVNVARRKKVGTHLQVKHALPLFNGLAGEVLRLRIPLDVIELQDRNTRGNFPSQVGALHDSYICRFKRDTSINGGSSESERSSS